MMIMMMIMIIVIIIIIIITLFESQSMFPTVIYLCPEMHAITQMANLTKLDKCI